MQEQFDVVLPANFVMPGNTEHLSNSLEQLFALQGAALSPMISAIQFENKPKFGPSAISNLRVEVVRYDLKSLKGRLRLLYDMQLTFGCEDFIKDHRDQHSYYNFSFNHTQALLHFESDAPEPASTADEF